MLRFEVLGELRVRRDGVELDLGPARQRAVLAVLVAYAPEPVSTDRIVAAVWPDGPPANGPNVVQKYVSALRRVLEPDRAVLERTAAGYRLLVGETDAGRALALVARARSAPPAEAGALLTEALAGWGAPAYAGVAGPVVEAERTRLGEARAAAWEDLAAAGLASGRAAELVPDLVRLVAEHPARERLRALLMTALHRSGRQAEALAAYQDARRHLADEYGVDPGDLLRATHAALLAPPPVAARPVDPPVPDPWAPPAEPVVGAWGAPGEPGEGAWAPPGEPVGPWGSPAEPARGGAGWRRVGWAVASAAVALGSVGTAGWAVIGFFAARRHSPLLALYALGWLALSVFSLVMLDGADPDGIRTGIGSVAMFGAALGGAAHGAALALERPRA